MAQARRHLEAARSLLPSPLKEDLGFASLRNLEYGMRINLQVALDALECLCAINDCSQEIQQELLAAAQILQQDASFKPLHLSPLSGHPRTRHLNQMRALEQMSEGERYIAGACVRAAAEGPFFPDWEFTTLFDLKREEVALVAAAWPDVDDRNVVVAKAIDYSMSNLFSYPHHKEQRLLDYVSASPEEILLTLRQWRKLKGWGHSMPTILSGG